MSTPVVLRPTRRARGSSPLTADAELHPFSTAAGDHLFVADGSRIYDLPGEEAQRVVQWCDRAVALEALAADPLAVALGISADSAHRYVDASSPAPPALTSLSLNVMQACNMSCGYCYADEGRFGGSVRRMTADVARRAVDRLVAEARPGADLVLGFMGGEPLLNRAVVHEACRYAAEV
ncbi:MAG: radical SAM protein, partial [Actinomycetota bacterium]|nr:radical SAM protein [Actinomycetota bacterium]